MRRFLRPDGSSMEEPTEDLDFSSLMCDEVGEEVFRQLEEEEAAEKTKKGDFTITSSSDTTKAAEEEQKSIDTKCPKSGDPAPSCPPPSGTESPNTLLPPTPRRRERIKYTTDQTEVLEAFYNEDCFPLEDKKKLIADSVGVTVKNISIWFQNRRKRGKKEDAVNRKLGAGQRRAESTPQSKISPIPPRRKRASHLSTKVPPARRSLLFRLSSPDKDREKPAHTSPLILAVLTGESSLGHCEALYLPIDTSQQSSTCNLQISYNAIQPDTSLPSTANLTANPPNSDLTSYLIFGPAGKPTGVVTISVISVQSQSTNMHSSDQHAGTAACQSHHGNRGPDKDQQPPSSVSLPQTEVFLSQESSDENSLDSLLNEVLTSTTTILPPVSAPQLSCLSVEETPPEELLEPQVSAASPERPPVSHHFEIDYEKYDKIHSHFYCDVSPTHFSF